MIRAGWVFLAVLPLAAQPKLLVNAQTDTRSAAAGLEREVKTLQSAQPQPAWIGYPFLRYALSTWGAITSAMEATSTAWSTWSPRTA